MFTEKMAEENGRWKNNEHETFQRLASRNGS